MSARSLSPSRWQQWQARLAPWRRLDWWLLGAVVLLTAWGGLTIRSVQGQGAYDWVQHWVTGAVGLAIALLLARSPYWLLQRVHWGGYALINLLLLAVMVAGTTIQGAQRWIAIGGLQFQPAEIAKLGIIVTLAALLHQRPARTLPAFLQALGVVAVPWGLVVLQPDLGTALVFGAIALGMLYWSGARPAWLALLVSPLVAALLFNLYLPGWFAWAALTVLLAWRSLPARAWAASATLALNYAAGELGRWLWGLLEPYQQQRLLLFLHPERDPTGGGYQLIQSRIAIGAGQLWGQGLNDGTQTQLDFIPEQHTDFIFAAVGEELGFAGSLALLLVYWLIALRLVAIACRAPDRFGALLAIGFLTLVFFQVTVNIGMTVGLSPITGLPLPWMSYGSSALLVNFMALGLVESVAYHWQPRARWGRR